MRGRHLYLCLAVMAISAGTAYAQQETPQLQVGQLPDDLRLDGHLDEAAWASTAAIMGLTMVEPNEGVAASMGTEVRVLADTRNLVIGILCRDPQPSKIVSWAVARDSGQSREDHVRLVLGPFRDGRSGYVFAVNPSGARFDGLISGRGEYTDSSWDGIWEAKTARIPTGWSVEIRIPIRTLSFAAELDSWDFNIERWIERRQELDRWSGASRDWQLTRTSHAGLLTGLPRFDLGLGLAVRPALVSSFSKPAANAASSATVVPSLDLSWKPTPEILVQLTFNTDFAETEVDTRQTNLTRFPLFFPEKRTFFLEGKDFFDFGSGLGFDLVPFHSRRIGLIGGEEVPLDVASKVQGRIGRTRFGMLAARTGAANGISPASSMGVLRLRQDIFAESSVGMLASFGDPEGGSGEWMAGSDFTYQTSSFWGDKNFSASVWGLTMDKDNLAGSSRSAMGARLDYPNDLWDVVFSWIRIGEDFDPSLGFVPRSGINKYRLGVDYMPRPEISWLRQMFYEFSGTYYTNLDGEWESWRMFTSPINWNLESGDSLEFNVVFEGDRPDATFDVAENVDVGAGTYQWQRYRITAESSNKRALSGEIAWWFGDFYDGSLNTWEATMAWNPIPLMTLFAGAELNRGVLPGGRFQEDLYDVRVRLNISPDLNFDSFVQYDTDTDSLGTNNRLRWTITPESDLFLVYTNNWQVVGSRFTPENYDAALKLQYELRF
jgi:uncharacterized protein DUF5916